LKIPFNIFFVYSSENKNHNYDVYNQKTLQSIRIQLEILLDYYTNRVKNKELIYNKGLPRFANIIRFRVKSELMCGAGVDFFTIISGGTIFSCAHLMNDVKYAIGNIKSNVTEKQAYIPVNVNEIKDCRHCWAKYLCSGGCPAQKISLGVTNQSAMSANECELEKIKWEFYLKLYCSILEIEPDFFK